MARRCTVCDHPKLADIDCDLVGRAQVSWVARKYGLTQSAVDRHKQHHITRIMSRAPDVEDAVRAESLLAKTQALYQSAVDILRDSQVTGKQNTALRAIREIRSTIELLAKLAGELDESTRVGVVVGAAIQTNVDGSKPDLSRLSENELLAYRALVAKMEDGGGHEDG